MSTHLDYGSNTTGKEGQVNHRVKRARPAEQDDHNNAPNQVAMSKLELQRRVTQLEKEIVVATKKMGESKAQSDERIEELIQTNQDLTNANRDLVKVNQELVDEDTCIRSG